MVVSCLRGELEPNSRWVGPPNHWSHFSSPLLTLSWGSGYTGSTNELKTPPFKGFPTRSHFLCILLFRHLCLALTFQKSRLQPLLFLLSSSLLLKLFALWLHELLILKVSVWVSNNPPLHCVCRQDLSRLLYRLWCFWNLLWTSGVVFLSFSYISILELSAGRTSLTFPWLCVLRYESEAWSREGFFPHGKISMTTLFHHTFSCTLT